MNLLYSKLEPKRRNYLPLILMALALLLPLTLIGFQILKPTGTYLNPMPKGSQASNPTKPLSFYLGTAQEALAKATTLANSNSSQTPQDKQAIIASLNQALAAANQAVSAYPNNPRSWEQRATILFSVAHLDPSVKPLAEQDLRTAQALSAGNLPEIPSINPIQTLPIEQASLAQNVIVASPQHNLPSEISNLTSNVVKSTAVLPAGQTSLPIANPRITNSSLIYLIPQSDSHNHPVYVSSKAEGSATITIEKPLATDLTIDYWIINQ